MRVTVSAALSVIVSYSSLAGVGKMDSAPLWDLAGHGGATEISSEKAVEVPNLCLPDSYAFTIEAKYRFDDVSENAVISLLDCAVGETGFGAYCDTIGISGKTMKLRVNGETYAGSGMWFLGGHKNGKAWWRPNGTELKLTITARSGWINVYQDDRLQYSYMKQVTPNLSPIRAGGEAYKRDKSKYPDMKGVTLLSLKIWDGQEAYYGIGEPKEKKSGFAVGKGWQVRVPRAPLKGEPNIFYFGDSISVGYTPSLTEMTKGRANLYHWMNCIYEPGAEGIDIGKFLEIGKIADYDYVVFNNGAHSTHWTADRVTDDQIRASYRELVTAFRKMAPNAKKLIYVMTTPRTRINEESEEKIAKLLSENVTIERLNRIAREVMTEEKIPIIDFYAKFAGRPDYWRGDGYHFLAPAYECISKAIVTEIGLDDEDPSTSGITGGKVSDATLVRMAPMAVEPAVDGIISDVEMKNASVNYAPISTNTGLVAVRYGVFYFGYTKKGVYFSARTSIPKAPMKLTKEDSVTLTLLPPGAVKPLTFTVGVADAGGELPVGVIAKSRLLKGKVDYGAHCAETEMFVPYPVLGVETVKNGSPWGLQMAVTYSCEAERAQWHWNGRAPEELGAFIPDARSPIVSFVQFGGRETYRDTGWYKMLFRFVNATADELPIASKSRLCRGLGWSKLNSNSEESSDFKFADISHLRNVVVPAYETMDVIHDECAMWKGSMNIMELDLSARGKTVYRRKLKWDLDKGKSWKDLIGLPNVDSAFFPCDGNRLRTRICIGRVKNLIRAGIRVVGDDDGKIYWEKEVKGNPHIWGGTFDTKLGELPVQGYTVKFAAVDGSGRKFSAERTFAVRKLPWHGLNLGKDRVILPPFKPIRVDGDRTEFLQTGYRSGGILWDEILSKGDNILTRPVDFKLNGESFTVVSSRVVSAEDDRVVREVKGRLGDIELTVTQEYDYDGYCMVTFAFNPKKPVTVKSLRLEAGIRNELAKLFEVARRNLPLAGPAPDFTLMGGEGEVWNSGMLVDTNKVLKGGAIAVIQPYVWFGGPFKGLSVLQTSVRDMSLEKTVMPERIVRRGGEALLECDFVNKEVVWDSPKTYKVAFQPTPVKPREWRNFAFAKNMYRYDCPTNAIGMSWDGGALLTGMMVGGKFGVPNNDYSLLKWSFAQKSKPADHKKFYTKVDEYVAKNAGWFGKNGHMDAATFKSNNQDNWRVTGIDYHTYYLIPSLLSCYWPEWEMYKAEWFVLEWPWDDTANEYLGRPSFSRIDKLLWDEKLALEAGYDGIYFDCYMLQCDNNFVANGGRSILKPNGEVIGSLGNFIEWRELVKRTATLCHTMGKDVHGRPLCEVHITEGVAIPVLGFATSGLCTERSGRAGEYQDRFPEGYVLADIIGGQAGTSSRIIVSTRVGDEARKERELKSLMGFMCAYGLFNLYDQDIIYAKWFEKAWNTVFDFGWGRPEVTPYFYYGEEKVPVAHNAKDVRLNVAKKGGAALLLFGNLGEATELAFDVAGLGFTNPRITDAETGEAVDPKRLAIDRHGYRMIRADDRGDGETE